MISRFAFAVSVFAVPALVTALVAESQRSPLETIEQLHTAFRNGDAKTVASLLHSEYHGVSLQGAPDHRHIYTEARAKAISDVAGLQPGDWDVRIMSSSTEIDPNGMAHVWARYVFYFKGKPNHCGRESYDLYQSERGWKIVSFADTDNPLTVEALMRCALRSEQAMRVLRLRSVSALASPRMTLVHSTNMQSPYE
jgi:hypothetical protein